MKIIVTTRYRDLFDDEPPPLEELLKDIPSMITISILASINSQLYLSSSKEIQFQIFRFLTQRQPADVLKTIWYRIKEKLERAPSTEFFGVLFNMEFIHWEMVHYRDFKINDTTPKQELNFLKAYFVIVDNYNNQSYDSYKKHERIPVDYFHKNIWPTLFDQFELNTNDYAPIGLIKGLVLLKSLQQDSLYTKYVGNFLLKNDSKNIVDYIFKIMVPLKQGWDLHNLHPTEDYPFSFSVSDENKDFFEGFVVIVKEYRKKYTIDKMNYSGLKDKPLFKFKDSFIVLNWNFLSIKLYEGLLFDFYNKSGIEVKFKKFIDFKNHISYNIIEKELFRKLIDKILNRKYSFLKFDDSEQKGFPDAYYRYGKCVFLIEIKDAYFPTKSISSFSYQKIRDSIDEKYNKNKKGTGQLIKQMVQLVKEPIEKTTFKNKKIKNRNLNIFPIMIYTNDHFGIPGVNQYLKREFKNKVQLNKLENEFKKINELTFISLSYLIKNIQSFSSNDFSLKEVIEKYHRYTKSKEQKFKKNSSIETLDEINKSFETFISEEFIEQKNPDSSYISLIWELFEMPGKNED